MKDFFPVSQSVLSTTALQSFVTQHYDLGGFISCCFLASGLNHTYLLEATGNQNYVLRVYRVNWRTLEAIHYEIEALLLMAEKGTKVSVPIADKVGNYIHNINAPEGKRYAVLFSFASGKPKYDDLSQAVLYGENAARVHEATNTSKSHYKRFSLDLDYLIKEPLLSITPYLTSRSKDLNYIEDLGNRLRERIDLLPLKELETGVCHGDFHFGNAHISDKGDFTFIDFDCCGFGWRAYDLAVYKWGLKLDDKTDFWTTFIESYQSVRSINEINLSAIPLFVIARQLWFIGLHTTMAYHWGRAHLDNFFLDKELERLREFDGQFLS